MGDLGTLQADLAFYELSEELREFLLIPFAIEVSGDCEAEDIAEAIASTINSHNLLLSEFTITHSLITSSPGPSADRSEIAIRASGTAEEVLADLKSTMVPISQGGRAWRFAVLSKRDEQTKTVVGLIHHMAADGQSLRIFLSTLASFLEGSELETTGDDADVYSKFIARVTRRIHDPLEKKSAISQWNELLAEPPYNPFSSLMSKPHAPSSPQQMSQLSVALPPGSQKHFGKLCSNLGVSEFELFHGIVLTALHTVGVPFDAPLVTATDLRDTLPTLDAIGNYSNLSILRVAEQEHEGLGDFILKLATSDRKILQLAHVPLSTVLSEATHGDKPQRILGPGIPSVSLSYGRAFPGVLNLADGKKLTPRPLSSGLTRHIVSFDLKPHALAYQRDNGVPEANDNFVVRFNSSKVNLHSIRHVRDRIIDILDWSLNAEGSKFISQWPELEYKNDLPLIEDQQRDLSQSEPTQNSNASDIDIEALEHCLCECYAKALSVSTVASDARFYDLGGYSLLALLVADMVTNETGSPIAVEEILNHQTPHAVAVRHFSRNDASVSVRTYDSESPTKGPVYLFFPPATGRSDCYEELSRRLGGDSSLLIDLPQKSNGVFDASRLVREAVSAIQHGLSDQVPLVFVGWSAGGMLAAYAAEYVRAMNEDANIGLILVDSYPNIMSDYGDTDKATQANTDLGAIFRNAYPIFGEYSDWYRRCSPPTGVANLDVLHFQSKESLAAGYNARAWDSLSDLPVMSLPVDAPHISLLSEDTTPQIANQIFMWLRETGKVRE